MYKVGSFNAAKPGFRIIRQVLKNMAYLTGDKTFIPGWIQTNHKTKWENNIMNKNIDTPWLKLEDACKYAGNISKRIMSNWLKQGLIHYRSSERRPTIIINKKILINF